MALCLGVLALAGCKGQSEQQEGATGGPVVIVADKACEASGMCMPPETLPSSFPAKCGCYVQYDSECSALLDKAYGVSAGMNMKSRLSKARAYGDPVQRQCAATTPTTN